MGKRNKGDFVKIPPLLGDLSPEEFAHAVGKIGENARLRYEATAQELLTLLTNNDPVAILAAMGWRFFAAQATRTTEDYWPAAQQHHLELLQALALRSLPPDVPEHGRLADVVQRVVDLLNDNTRSFNFSRMKGRKPGTEGTVERQALVMDQIRSTTQCVRGEFYSHQFDKYFRAIFSRIDNKFNAVHGIPGCALLETLQQLLRVIEDKINEHRRLGRRVVRSYNAKRAVKAYFEAFPEETVRRDHIIADATARRVRPDLMRYFLVEEAERLLPRVYSFGEEDISASCPKDADAAAARRAIEAWSLAFGDLKEYSVDHLYLANPVWDRPFIRLPEGRFFWPRPVTFFSFGFEMFERLMAAYPILRKNYEDARADVLEEELGLLLKKYFRNGRVIRGAKWRISPASKPYENDVVVVIDRTGLIFEAQVRCWASTASPRRAGSSSRTSWCFVRRRPPGSRVRRCRHIPRQVRRTGRRRRAARCTQFMAARSEHWPALSRSQPKSPPWAVQALWRPRRTRPTPTADRLLRRGGPLIARELFVAGERFVRLRPRRSAMA